MQSFGAKGITPLTPPTAGANRRRVPKNAPPLQAAVRIVEASGLCTGSVRTPTRSAHPDESESAEPELASAHAAPPSAAPAAPPSAESETAAPRTASDFQREPKRHGAEANDAPASKRHAPATRPTKGPPGASDVVGRPPAPAPARQPTAKPARKRLLDDEDEDDDDDGSGGSAPEDASRAANRFTTESAATARAPAAEVFVPGETRDDAVMAPVRGADSAASVVTLENGSAQRRAPAPKPTPAPREPFFSPAPIPAPEPARFSLAERAPPASPTGAELAAMFPAEGDTVEIIWQKDTTLEADGAGDRCIVASLRGPFPDKKKKRRSSTSLPAYHVYAELHSLVRLAGDQEHAFERVDETDRRPKHVHPKYKLSLHARGTVWRRVDNES